MCYIPQAPKGACRVLSRFSMPKRPRQKVSAPKLSESEGLDAEGQKVSAPKLSGRPEKGTPLYLRPGQSLRQSLEARASSEGITPNQLALRLLSEALGTQARGSAPMPRPARRYETPSRQRNQRLTPSEDRLLCALAEREGMSPSAYILAGLRTTLTKAPQPTQREIDALDRSTYQVQSIGVNLNQIARRLNERAHQELPGGLVETVQAVADQVRAHRQVVELLVKASVERWT